MMKEEFTKLILKEIDRYYPEIEAAYMEAPDTIYKGDFAKMFFKNGMDWCNKVHQKSRIISDFEKQITAAREELSELFQ